jgi:hypothetical protein
MTAAAHEAETPAQLSQELLSAFPLPPTNIYISPSRSPLSTQYEPYHSPRASRRPHTDSRLPLPEESPSPLPQLASSRTALACPPAAEPSGVPPVGFSALPQETEQLAPQSQIRLPHESPLPPLPPPPLPPPPLPSPRSRATSSHVAVLGSGAAGAVAEVVAIKVAAETGAGADASTTPPRRQRAALTAAILASGDMEEPVSRQGEPGRESPILVTFHQVSSPEPAPLPIGVVYAYNTDTAAGRTRSPSQLSASCDARSGAAAQRGLSYHEDVQSANSCGNDEATRGGDSGGSAAAGIRRSGSRIAWLSPRRRSQRARAEREEREVEKALGEVDKPGARLEQELFGGEDLEWIRDRNGAQLGGPTRALPMAPLPTSLLPRMLVKALSGARRGAARRDAGAAPATATATANPAPATPAILASASPVRSLVEGSAALDCGCAPSSCSSLPHHRAAPQSDGRSRRSHRTSKAPDLTSSESTDPHPRCALSGPGIDGDSAP